MLFLYVSALDLISMCESNRHIYWRCERRNTIPPDAGVQNNHELEEMGGKWKVYQTFTSQ